jgi:hypothetical protein
MRPTQCIPVRAEAVYAGQIFQRQTFDHDIAELGRNGCYGRFGVLLSFVELEIAER